MTTPALEALKAELMAAEDALAAPIRGLDDWTHVSLSSEAKAIVDETLAAYLEQSSLITAALLALDQLAGNSYPTITIPDVPAAVSLEFQGQIDDEEAGFAVFPPPAVAANLTLDLGEPAEKP